MMTTLTRISPDLLEQPWGVSASGVNDDSQVHFAILPGSVAKNRHLLDRTVA